MNAKIWMVLTIILGIALVAVLVTFYGGTTGGTAIIGGKNSGNVDWDPPLGNVGVETKAGPGELIENGNTGTQKAKLVRITIHINGNVHTVWWAADDFREAPPASGIIEEEAETGNDVLFGKYGQRNKIIFEYDNGTKVIRYF